MKKGIDKAKADAIEAQRNTRNAMSKAAELESHSVVLNDLLIREIQDGRSIQRQTSSLAEQTRMVRQVNADATMAAAMAQAAADAEAAAAATAAKGPQPKLARTLKEAPFESATDASKSPSASEADSEASKKSKPG